MAGFVMSAWAPSWFVARVNGGFIITRSKPRSGKSAMTWAAVSYPALPVRMAGSLVLNSVITAEVRNISSEPNS